MTYHDAYAEGFCKAAEVLGVSPRRLAVRMAVKEAALTKRAADHSTANVASEVGGLITPLALLGIAGRAASRGRLNTGAAAYLASRVTGAGNGIGALTALIKNTRTNAAQRTYDSENHVLKNLLLPGSGAYNMWKRVGNKMRGE